MYHIVTAACLLLRTRANHLAILCCTVCSPVAAAVVTHGPMIGHTTHTSTRVWVRANTESEIRVQVVPEGRAAEKILSKSVLLRQENYYCGVADVDGLKPRTTYRYQILLNGIVQESPVLQRFTTFPVPGEQGVVRIGFGHSVRGDGEQTTWRAVAAKKPDLFILMGDNVYSNTTDPGKHRRMYLSYRGDPCFRAFAATTPIYAVWDDHDFGANNSDRTQPGKERSLKTFNEIWANPLSEAKQSAGIWTRFTVGGAEFYLLDVRYHRSPNSDRDGPEKTMLGEEQRNWLMSSLAESNAVFRFPVSGSSWNCGGVEAWNHQFTHEYNAILAHLATNRITGVILLGGDQHHHKIGVRPRESWGGYDLHEWMAGQLWNTKRERELSGFDRGFGLITVDTTNSPAVALLEFFDDEGNPRQGRRIPYTTPGALRVLWDSPPGVTGEPPRSIDGELRPATCGPIWESLPATTGETLTEDDLRFPAND